jgi:hypothetical protein
MAYQNGPDTARNLSVGDLMRSIIGGGSDFHSSSSIVEHMDLGFSAQAIYPTLSLLRIIQPAAVVRQDSEEIV